MAITDVPLLSGSQPVLGHTAEFQRDRFALFDRLAREVDGLARLHLPHRDIVIANSPDTIRELLITRAKCFEKPPLVRRALYPLVGDGLITSGGELWKRQRRIMAPVFQHTQIEALASFMIECTERACQRRQRAEVVDVTAETTRIAMAIAGQTLFGVDTFEEADALGEAISVALSWADRTSTSMYQTLQVEMMVWLLEVPGLPAFVRERLARRLLRPKLWPTRRNRELRAALRRLDQRVKHMIDERRAAGSQRADLLSHLLDARADDGSKMDDKQVRDEILTLFVAGHETSAYSAAWALYLLARHPQAYARARAEVAALGGRTPNAADLGYLSRVFKEALRLYPPVYLFTRFAITDVELAGYRLPKGALVVVCPYALHRRPDLWPNPHSFDPSRFEPEAEAARPRGAYLPFSDGPRVCIGQRFATLEGPLVLATLLQHADFELAARETAPVELDLRSPTLRPRGGIELRITPLTAARPALTLEGEHAPEAHRTSHHLRP